MSGFEKIEGAEATDNSLEVIIKEESLSEDVYQSTSGIEKENATIKLEPELDLEVEPELLERGGVWYICHHCQQNFAFFKELRAHIKICFSLHNRCLPSSEDQKLPNVADNVPGNNTLQGHCSLDTKGAKYSCSYCNYSTAVYTILNTHIKSKHIKHHVISKHSNGKCESCPHSDYIAVQSQNLKLHVMCKHDKDKPYSCLYCDYRTVWSQQLKRHILQKHTNDKPYPCPHCDYSGIRATQLKIHIMHKHTKHKPLSCPHCDYSAVHSQQLKQHIISKHSNDKPHSCPHCDYSTIWPQDLKRHIMAKHTNIKPHSCPHCDYSAVQAQNLKRHVMRKH